MKTLYHVYYREGGFHTDVVTLDFQEALDAYSRSPSGTFFRCYENLQDWVLSDLAYYARTCHSLDMDTETFLNSNVLVHINGEWKQETKVKDVPDYIAQTACDFPCLILHKNPKSGIKP